MVHSGMALVGEGDHGGPKVIMQKMARRCGNVLVVVEGDHAKRHAAGEPFGERLEAGVSAQARPVLASRPIPGQ